MNQRAAQADPDTTALLTTIEQIEDDVAHHDYERLVMLADRIETRLIALEAAAQMALDFWGLSTPEFVDRYGHGITTRDVADRLRAALATKEAPCQH